MSNFPRWLQLSDHKKDRGDYVCAEITGPMGQSYGTVTDMKEEFIESLLKRSNAHDALVAAIQKLIETSWDEPANGIGSTAEQRREAKRLALAALLAAGVEPL